METKKIERAKPKIVKEIQALILPDSVFYSTGCCGHAWFFDKDYDSDGMGSPSWRVRYDVKYKWLSIVSYKHEEVSIRHKRFDSIAHLKAYFDKIGELSSVSA